MLIHYGFAIIRLGKSIEDGFVKSINSRSRYRTFLSIGPQIGPQLQKNAKNPSDKTPEGLNLLERVARFELVTHGLGSRQENAAQRLK